MTIPIQDIKTLWSRAAGLCSMPECRQKLTPESNTTISGAVIIGENCHIIGESTAGPRGNTPIPESDRNRYPNLILLCRNHHKIIDSDTDAWPVEKLREIKNAHERWIETSLQSLENDTPELIIYKNIVATISELLLLEFWDEISDYAIRNLAHVKWIDGIYKTNLEVRRAHWPRTKLELEESICNLNSRAYTYAENYMSLVWLPRSDSSFYKEDRTWKRDWNPNYKEHQLKSENWERENMRLLLNLNHAMNEFAASVRAHLDPYFYIKKGEFCIHDAEGVTNMLKETWIMTDHYRD